MIHLVITDALELMEFNSIDELDKKALSIRFKKLARQHHPDLYYLDNELMKKHESIMKSINEAYETLRILVDKLDKLKKIELSSKRTEIFAIIPFESLIDLYNGKDIKVKDSNGEFKITKANIRAHRVFLMIDCIISYADGSLKKDSEFSSFNPFIISDKYEIYCDIDVNDDRELPVTVKICNKSIDILLKNSITRLNLKFENNISLVVNIRKKVKDKG